MKTETKLKVTDLMVGDWVRTKDGVFRVYQLPWCDNQIKLECRGRIYNVDMEEVMPIEITGALLTKNGFIYDEHYMRFTKGTLSLIPPHSSWKWTVSIQEYECYNACILHIDYVHELQHAFKLFKYDNEIVL